MRSHHLGTNSKGDAGERPPHCSNCGSVGVIQFCPACGQKRAELRLPLSEFVADGLSTLVSFDNRLFRTLTPLLLKPGLVTVETLAGHRARYVPPLRMYLIISFVFFICLQLFGNVLTINENDGNLNASSGGGMIQFSTTANEDAAATATESEAEEPGVAVDQLPADDEPNTPDAEDEDLWFGGVFEEIAARPEQAASALLARLPWMIFLLVPVAAIWLRLLFRKDEKYYVPHLVASTHLHTAVLAFLTLSQLAELLPGPDVIGVLLFLYTPIYVARSLKRIYGRSWFSTAWRLGFLSIVHMIALLAALFGSLVLAGLSLS